MNKLFPTLAIIGEILVLAAAMLWASTPKAAGWLLIAAAVLFIVGRMSGPSGDYKRSTDLDAPLTLRRLYRLRVTGYLFLAFATILMNTPGGFYWGIYLRPSLWLVPFVIFAVLEIYTAFRIPAEEKNL